MAQAEIRDTSLWVRHIHGDPQLAGWLAGVRAGEVVTLWIDGERGEFEKMKDAPNGPMPGFKPIGATRELWRRLYPARRGEMVSVSRTKPGHPGSAPQREWAEATDVERDAAWEAFKALRSAGWRSDGSRLDRDELHER